LRLRYMNVGSIFVFTTLACWRGDAGAGMQWCLSAWRPSRRYLLRYRDLLTNRTKTANCPWTSFNDFSCCSREIVCPRKVVQEEMNSWCLINQMSEFMS
jgi:hypothetical protein